MPKFDKETVDAGLHCPGAHSAIMDLKMALENLYDLGLVVRVDNEPMTPLRMGYYSPVIDVRMGRPLYTKIMEEGNGQADQENA